jgi:hypothetical protein
MTISCCCLLRFNTTIKEGDGSRLLSLSSLEHHHRRKQRHIVIIFFFFATPSQKKTTALLLLKHRKDKTYKETTKKKPREGREFTFKLSVCPFILNSWFCRFVSSTFSWHLLLLKQKKREHKENKNHRKLKKTEKGKSLLFFFCFYIWDEAFLLPSSLHIHSTLSSPPSSSLVFHVSSKLYAIQA